MTKVLLPFSVLAGLAIAWIDSRPTWDDTAITVFALLAFAGIFASIEPRRPWLWALTVGIWTPSYSVLLAHNYSGLIAIAFPFVGAYLGAGMRRLIAAGARPE